MAGLGTLVNVIAVLAGTTIGVLVGHRLPDGVQERVLRGLGLITLVIGIEMALDWKGTSTLYVLGGVLLGGIAGELMRIEDRLMAFGETLQRQFASGHEPDGPDSHHPTVAEGFFTASLLFCVGAMAVIGSFEDGLLHDPDTLLTKAVLDGFASIALAASLGWGVGLSVIAIVAYQGSLTLLAGSLSSVLTEGSDELLAMTSAGGILIMGIALKLLDLADIKVGNYLPAILFAPLIAAVAKAGS
ncbi:MAG TPA: DUF554 domain-containing protein [Baekduia sp.]|nr:DUF554 domain-containing protein [Baekduia sp.]